MLRWANAADGGSALGSRVRGFAGPLRLADWVGGLGAGCDPGCDPSRDARRPARRAHRSRRRHPTKAVRPSACADGPSASRTGPSDDGEDERAWQHRSLLVAAGCPDGRRISAHGWMASARCRAGGGRVSRPRCGARLMASSVSRVAAVRGSRPRKRVRPDQSGWRDLATLEKEPGPRPGRSITSTGDLSDCAGAFVHGAGSLSRSACAVAAAKGDRNRPLSRR